MKTKQQTDWQKQIQQWDQQMDKDLWRPWPMKPTHFWYVFKEWLQQQNISEELSANKFAAELRKAIQQNSIKWEVHNFNKSSRYRKEQTGYMISKKGKRYWYINGNEISDADDYVLGNNLNPDDPNTLMLLKLTFG